jgi:chromosome segregation protein
MADRSLAALLSMMATDDPSPASETPPRPLLRFDKLRIAGFKSFVDPVDVLIEPGLTGIVGPNGCGKSNLIEALRWVMGESSARQMRGGEMEDVIFNGTATRPARDVAEVVIELGNAARAAPPPFNGFDSLEISRRIGRARGSMYRVNGKEVRARDVQLLLADSATGARSTAIVSQGQVGGLIAAKPQERRVILEEAAGITGLHSRRHEADMRLRSAEANLERLEDVVATLEAQLQGLRKQARQAGRYRILSEQIRAAETLWYKLRWRSACEALSQARKRVADAEAAADDATRAAAAASARQAKAAAALPPLRRLDADAAAELQRLTLAQDGLDAEDRRVAADRHACRLRLDQAAADLRREQTLVADADAALVHLAAEKARIEASREEEAEAQAAASTELAAVDAEVERLDAAVGALTAAVASAEADRSAIQRRVRDLEAHSRRLAARAADLAAQLSSLEQQRQRQEMSDTDATSGALAAASAALEIARTAAAVADDEQDAAAAAAADALAAHQVAAAEHGRLRAEEKALGQVLALDEPAQDAPVVDALSAQPGLEAAVAAALGDDLLAPLAAAAPRYWRTLPPLEAVPPLPPGIPSLASFVSAPPALERCLTQIGLVTNDGEGERLQAALSPGQRLVTREGAQWRWDGLTATPGGSPSAVRLRQRNRLIEVREQAADAVAVLDMAAERLEKARALANVAADADRQARAAVRSSEAVYVKARDGHSEARERLAKVAAQRDAVEANLRAAQNEQGENDTALRAASAELADLPDPATARDQLAVLRRELTEKRTLQSDRRLAEEALIREVEGRRRRLEAIEGDAGSWAARREAGCRQLAILEARQAAAEAELDQLSGLPATIAARRDALLNEIETALSARRTASDELAAAEAALAEADRNARAAAGALIGAREDRVRAEAAAEQAEAVRQLLAARIAEALGLDPQRLDAAVVDGEGQAARPDPDAVERRLDRMRRDRDMIGPVNLCADQEATELAGRIKTLVNERLDLLTAIAKLRQGLAELDREGRERLMASFADIDHHFRELFVRLFGGGRAHLALTESEDPLDAGLEIMASPPGKRLQALSLLSGGEQALATLALVFAVFLSTPAPICVLDEVDAPLDDANVDRLCALLSDLTVQSGTRFLIITHHRMTMARMDRLFGVTMAEKGVSQLVSVDLLGADQQRQSA